MSRRDPAAAPAPRAAREPLSDEARMWGRLLTSPAALDAARDRDVRDDSAMRALARRAFGLSE